MVWVFGFMFEIFFLNSVEKNVKVTVILQGVS